MAIRHSLSPVLSAAFQSIVMSAALGADGKHTPQKIGAGKHTTPQKKVLKEKKKNNQQQDMLFLLMLLKAENMLQSTAHISYLLGLGGSCHSSSHSCICIAINPCNLYLCSLLTSLAACQLSSSPTHTHTHPCYN